MSDYSAFLEQKQRRWIGAGVDHSSARLPRGLYPFQERLTRWALRKGRGALWADTGLGKTRMQLAWADVIPGRVLILAPLCVGTQTIREAARIGVRVGAFGSGERIEITNYERLHHVQPADYAGVVLDESSILKSMDGRTRTLLIQMFRDTVYRLCCTATPAPNDIAELANHCEFLGVMTRPEMLATFFVHDEDGWRLKRHGTGAFYRWLATWGMYLRRPSDIGEDDTGYDLPPLTIHDVVVGSRGITGDALFAEMNIGGVQGRNKARKGSLRDRVNAAVALVAAEPDEPWVLWCGLNDEQDALAAAIHDAVSVAGNDKPEDKERRLLDFIDGRVRVLITKPRIAGFGLNLQRCARMAFVGLGDSYEQYYQAIRRCWRFGQTRPVDAHVIVSDHERAVVANVRRKESDANDVATRLITEMREVEMEELGMTERQTVEYETGVASGDGWEMRLGDCVDQLRTLRDDSVDLSVYSPPFVSLYTYTASDRDIGNCATREQFLEHFGYVVREVLRVTKPGRLTCCHIAQATLQKAKDGVIGLQDLRGMVIDLFLKNGWIHHGEIVIDKDPQAQAIRTKSKSLLFVQLKKDSSWLRPALADFICVFRKPGDNIVPVKADISNEDWIEWARPIWYGIRESDTLNVASARGNDDERHICPLQLGTIERCVRLWSNPGELVLSPFGGIGSEGFESLRHGRRYLGIELKREYWQSACKNLRDAESLARGQGSLFAKAV